MQYYWAYGADKMIQVDGWAIGIEGKPEGSAYSWHQIDPFDVIIMRLKGSLIFEPSMLSYF